MKRKIIVCGATGFIGRNMAEAFCENKNNEVYGTYFGSRPLHNPKIRMIRVDLTRKEEVDKAIKGKDIVIQAAATTSGIKDIIEKPYYHVTDNAVMNSLIFRSAYEFKVSHVVFFSCTVMYQSSRRPIEESDFDANKELYHKYFGVGWTKVYIEKMCKFYSQLGKTKYTVIRHSNIYGPYDKFDLKKSHVFGATITKVMRSANGKISIWGNGKEERDLLFASDLVDFVGLAIKKQKTKFQLCNVGYGKSISIRELINKIIFLSKRKIQVEYDLSKPSINTRICLNITRAKKIFGWEPKISLEQGIIKTIEWCKNNINSKRSIYG